ncbi:toll-like receptor 21 [Neosynchiropus ocellatus]
MEDWVKMYPRNSSKRKSFKDSKLQGSEMAAFDWRLFLAMLLAVIPTATCYGFSHCIEEPWSRGTVFKCYRRTARSISAIVGDLPSSATNLTISLTPVKSIPEWSFANLTKLRSLQLDRNNISRVEPHAFRSLGHLRSLNLSCNNISELHPAVFEGLHNLTLLALTNNKLKTLPEGILLPLVNLKRLLLRHNFLRHFSNIAESLSTLTNITMLDLCFNILSNLRHSNHSLPQSLQVLYICRNNLSTLGCGQNFLATIHVLDLSNNAQLNNHAFSGLNLRHVYYLRLRSTNVSIVPFVKTVDMNVGSIDFSNTGIRNDTQVKELCSALKKRIRTIKSLNLCTNGPLHLSNGALDGCPQIAHLNVSGNDVRDWNCLEFLDKHRQINVFVSEHNNVSQLQTCEGKPFFFSLRELSFRYNHILWVKNCAFCHTPNITTLKLNINRIADLGLTALKGLRQLQTLRLDNNLLTELFDVTFQDLDDLRVLNLRNNRISVIFNNTFANLKNLWKLDLGGNKITHVTSAGFRGLQSLSNLYLDGNKLQQIEHALHPVFWDSLTVLDLERNSIRFLSHNTYSPFAQLSKLQDLKLGSQLLHGLANVPQRFFHGLHSLTTLYFDYNQIIYISPDAFDDLTSLQFLTLTACCAGDVQLQPGTFKNLRNLTKLIIENTGMEQLSEHVVGNLTKLAVLQINHNGIKSINISTLQRLPKLHYLDFRNVPLSCTCKNKLLQNWTVRNPKVQVVNLYSLPCQNDERHKFYNFDTRVCYVDIGHYLFFSTAFVVVLFTASPILYVKLYWKLKYGCYVFRSWFREQWRRIREEQENCKYDAFISYNSSDENWVMDYLLPNLEGNGSSFKLCLHHRDFELGRDIVDNIVTAVYSSRKTICIVSKNFLRSEWCSLEIQLASYRLFDEHRDVLLLVFLEPISDRQMSSYHRMRKVMLKKTYLQWPGSDCANPDEAQNLFWMKLRRAMKTGSQLDAEESDSNTNAGREAKDHLENYYLQP